MCQNRLLDREEVELGSEAEGGVPFFTSVLEKAREGMPEFSICLDSIEWWYTIGDFVVSSHSPPLFYPYGRKGGISDVLLPSSRCRVP